MAKKEQTYSGQFYEFHKQYTELSAERIMPVVLKMVQPASVIDIGCGLGDFLAVCRNFGIEDIIGMDGEWIDKGSLHISPERFIVHDLKQPIRIDRKFDLVVCLEVAEHLPHTYSHMLIESLTSLSSVILFSAAIPYQGGTNHLNEQWPEYWQSLFAEQGYLAVDCIRKRIWDDESIASYYIQNILLYVQQDYLKATPVLKREYELSANCPLSLVHPRRYLALVNSKSTTLGPSALLAALPLAIKNALSNRARMFAAKFSQKSTHF